MRYQLRDYQQAAVQAAQSKHNGVLVEPTGSGKSLVIAALARNTEGETLVLQPTKEILEQNVDKMHAFGEYDIGIYSASCSRKDIGRVTFATIGSVYRKPELFGRCSLVIVDECHLVNAKQGMYEMFLGTLDLPTIGLTATPYRLRHYRNSFNAYAEGELVAESRVITRTRPRVFSTIKHVTQVADLFRTGYLCPLRYAVDAAYNADEIQGNSTGQGYDDHALISYNQMRELPRKIAEAAAASPAKHILAFTIFRSETEKAMEQMSRLGVTCAEVCGETPKKERERLLAAFRAGNVRCVVNVGVLTTGFDWIASSWAARPDRSPCTTR
jgi:DNA repair protein RadD